MKLRLPVAAALALSLFAVPAMAQSRDSTVWKKVGNWIIAPDSSLGGSCYMTTSFNSGVILRIGFNLPTGPAPLHMVVASPSWKSIKPDKVYDVALQLDKNPMWKTRATGMAFPASKALIMPIGDMRFVMEIVKKNYLKVFFGGDMIAQMSLKNSSTASTEMARCNAVSARPQAPATAQGDPFAPPGGASKSEDPFAAKPETKDTSDPFAM
ncbi:hypothetical protein [Oryzifoliimicrobium ureilyticus]|uniref:hypothetical protein n=1 Tax=Oryzifoliimicrobium ureilyticus TaxID=3113724 RepID=UPI003075F3B0